MYSVWFGWAVAIDNIAFQTDIRLPLLTNVYIVLSRFIKPYRSTELKESDGQKRSIVLKFNKEF